MNPSGVSDTLTPSPQAYETALQSLDTKTNFEENSGSSRNTHSPALNRL